MAEKWRESRYFRGEVRTGSAPGAALQLTLRSFAHGRKAHQWFGLVDRRERRPSAASSHDLRASAACQKLPPVRHPESSPSPLPPPPHEPPASAPPPQGLGQDDAPPRPPKSGSARGTGAR